jgi:peptide-methionine (R)-S-oxide reductase
MRWQYNAAVHPAPPSGRTYRMRTPLRTFETSPPAGISRRGFLTGSTLALAALAIGCARKSEAAVAPGKPGKTVIAECSNAGKRLRTVEVDKVVKTDAQWQQQLAPLAYQVTRHAGTERAFSGPLLNEHRKGVFRCVCCNTALYDSSTKFESGTGWPSFWQPIARENVVESNDSAFGMSRTAISCPRCDAHLGHVFDDGPKPTGLRYCMNSVALTFARA